MPAALARWLTIFHALMRSSRYPVSSACPRPKGRCLMERGTPPRFAQPGKLVVFGEVALERVMTGHIVELAALLVEPHPEPALLMEDVGGLLERNPAIEHCRFGGELVQQLRDGRKALVKSCLNPTLRACTR